MLMMASKEPNDDIQTDAEMMCDEATLITSEQVTCALGADNARSSSTHSSESNSGSKIKSSLPNPLVFAQTARPFSTSDDRQHLKFLNHMPDELNEENFEILLLHAEEDRDNAEKFKQHLQKEIIYNVHESSKHPTVKLLEEIRPGSAEPIELAFSKALFVFLFVTKAFCEDTWTLLRSHACLTEAIQDDKKKWCVIPVHTNPRRDKGYKLPMMLNTLRPINYWIGHEDQFYVDGVKKLLESNSGLYLEKDRLLDERRKEYFHANREAIKKNYGYLKSQSQPSLQYFAHTQESDMPTQKTSYSKDDCSLCDESEHCVSTLTYSSLPNIPDAKAFPSEGYESVQARLEAVHLTESQTLSSHNSLGLNLRNEAVAHSADIQLHSSGSLSQQQTSASESLHIQPSHQTSRPDSGLHLCQTNTVNEEGQASPSSGQETQNSGESNTGHYNSRVVDRAAAQESQHRITDAAHVDSSILTSSHCTATLSSDNVRQYAPSSPSTIVSCLHSQLQSFSNSVPSPNINRPHCTESPSLVSAHTSSLASGGFMQSNAASQHDFSSSASMPSGASTQLFERGLSSGPRMSLGASSQQLQHGFSSSANMSPGAAGLRMFDHHYITGTAPQQARIYVQNQDTTMQHPVPEIFDELGRLCLFNPNTQQHEPLANFYFPPHTVPYVPRYPVSQPWHPQHSSYMLSMPTGNSDSTVANASSSTGSSYPGSLLSASHYNTHFGPSSYHPLFHSNTLPPTYSSHMNHPPPLYTSHPFTSQQQQQPVYVQPSQDETAVKGDVIDTGRRNQGSFSAPKENSTHNSANQVCTHNTTIIVKKASNVLIGDRSKFINKTLDKPEHFEEDTDSDKDNSSSGDEDSDDDRNRSNDNQRNAPQIDRSDDVSPNIARWTNSQRNLNPSILSADAASSCSSNTSESVTARHSESQQFQTQTFPELPNPASISDSIQVSFRPDSSEANSQTYLKKFDEH